ncbi:MAG TPA: ATP-binding protein [Desulfobacterales bacterium]|jgi:PAS domain S-box-containing protein|nr:ATP-binding protein [Desulfobacterales bacterium]
MKEDGQTREIRLKQAEDFIEALRSEEVDAVVGKAHVLLLRLRETEERLRRSELRYRHIVESQTEMICRRRPDGAISFANPAYCRFVGRSLESLLDRPFMPAVHPEDQAAVEAAIKGLRSDRPLVDIECRITDADGSTTWTYWHLQGFFDDGGKLMETQAIGRDISGWKRAQEELKRKHRELADLNAQLNAAYQELSDYSEAVVHDIGAVLRAVSNYSRFLDEDLAPRLDGQERECLTNLQRIAATGGMLLGEFKNLARVGRQTQPPARVDFAEMLDDLQAMLGPDPAIKLVLPPTWPALNAPPSLVRSILSNLLSNAVKFNRAAQKRVEVGWRTHAPGRVELYVRDNGIGIDPRFHERIFGIFKRLHTNGEYDGAGMGLAVVRKAARHLGGSVRVVSEPGRGSTFFVDLPL